jgi:hypothetical protein
MPLSSRPRRELHGARLVIFMALLGVHGLAVFLLATQRNAGSHTPDDGFSTTVFFVDRSEPREPAPAMTLRAPSPAKPVAKQESPERAPLPETPMPATAPVTIDWAKEAERAAARSIEAEEEARRRASGLIPGLGPNIGTAVARPAPHEFGWDHAHIHRVEQIPDGGLIVNLNDRCAIVIKFPWLLGGCKLGKIEARGDLFSHMHDD